MTKNLLISNQDIELTTTFVATQIANLFTLLLQRSQTDGFTRLIAQKFILNSVFILFTESPDTLWSNIDDKTSPIQLTKAELHYLTLVSQANWSQVKLTIFGSIFEATLSDKERHQGGIHYTSEDDIMKIIKPTISNYWNEKITHAHSIKELEKLQQELSNYRVLDPACGSGNFLYMAYQELKQIEKLLLAKLAQKTTNYVLPINVVTPKQFYGIDQNILALELAKTTLLIAEKMSQHQAKASLIYPTNFLDQNLINADALFVKWPRVNAIIGNPPFQSKNKMQQEFGAKYVKEIRDKYPDIPGRADYCVYWFKKAHDHLPENGRAGLVGTNTITQNYSREGGLDYIVNHGGTIIEAVASQIWSGAATVRVSIVNWIKGEKEGKKKLYQQLGDRPDSPWQMVEVDRINSSLSSKIDVTSAQKIIANTNSSACYQGQTHGHEGFLLTPELATLMLQTDPRNADVIFPYLTGDNLLSSYPPKPSRFVIDFQSKDLHQASQYDAPFQHIKLSVLPSRELAAKQEAKRNQELLKNQQKVRVNRHHQNFLNKWWLLSYPRTKLIEKIQKIPRYIVCSRVTKRPIFEFINAAIRPGDALQVFPLADDYSFGILQSNIHGLWFTEKCSTLGSGFRYTSETVFDTFPWPQNPSVSNIKDVVEAAVRLREIRHQVITKNNGNLRKVYENFSFGDANGDRSNHDLGLLQIAHLELDQAVSNAYGMSTNQNILQFLLDLNLALVAQEKQGHTVIGPS